jgi:hypothetical protein
MAVLHAFNNVRETSPKVTSKSVTWLLFAKNPQIVSLLDSASEKRVHKKNEIVNIVSHVSWTDKKYFPGLPTLKKKIC